MTRVLCLHGLGGTGATMWPVVAACIDAGCTVLAPTLPGHGGDPADLLGATWDDWMEAARSWQADVVVGQSMGAALALQLAAERRCRGIVCINPIAPSPDALEGLEWRKSRGQTWIDVEPSGVEENDDIVDPASSDVIASALKRTPARLRLLHSGHVATLDRERHVVQKAVVDFVSGNTGSRRTRGR
jgi:esterase/lipase